MAQFTCNYISKVLGRAITVNAIVPSPAFGETERDYHPAAAYPVLYLLPGDGCDETTWMRLTSIERYAEENHIAVVTCPVENTAGLDQIVYIPFGSTQASTDPESRFIDIRRISFSRLIAEELVEFITGYLPVSRRREDMYLAGQGEGAYTALLLGLKTNCYSAVGAFGYQASNCAALFDVIARASEHGGTPELFLAGGDPEDTAMLEEKLTAAKIPFRREPIEKGREWARWDGAVKAFMEQLPRCDAYAALPKRRL